MKLLLPPRWDGPKLMFSAFHVLNMSPAQSSCCASERATQTHPAREPPDQSQRFYGFPPTGLLLRSCLRVLRAQPSLSLPKPTQELGFFSRQYCDRCELAPRNRAASRVSRSPSSFPLTRYPALLAGSKVHQMCWHLMVSYVYTKARAGLFYTVLHELCSWRSGRRDETKVCWFCCGSPDLEACFFCEFRLHDDFTVRELHNVSAVSIQTPFRTVDRGRCGVFQ